MSDDEVMRVVRSRAEALANRLRNGEESFSEFKRGAGEEYTDLVASVSSLNERFSFDRGGRPGAIAAVREALPVMERDLFDAVIEDHECELAAVSEALYQVALALCAQTRQPL